MFSDPIDTSASGGRHLDAGGIYGVADHIYTFGFTSRNSGNFSADPDGAVSTTNTLHTPQVIGDINAVYLEDIHGLWTLNNSGNGFTDNYTGSRSVARYSWIRNNNVGVHGFDSQVRGVCSFEWYKNTFIADPLIDHTNHYAVGGGVVGAIRSGTGYVWGNVIENLQPQGGDTGWLGMVNFELYGTFDAAGDINYPYAQRPNAYYPLSPWGALPYPGTTTTPLDDGFGNRLTGNNPLDGNFKGVGSWDPDTARTIMNVTTVAGSTTITAASGANFTGGPNQFEGDLQLAIDGTNIPPARKLNDASLTNGSNVLYSPSGFKGSDVGRDIAIYPSGVDLGVQITALNDSTHAVMSKSATITTSGTTRVFIEGTYIKSIPTQGGNVAILNSPADGSTTNGTITLGFHDQGYPALDQPGWTSFPTTADQSSSTGWPNNPNGYTSTNYEQLSPIYFFMNSWPLDSAPKGAGTYGYGTAAYVKANREYYEDNASFDGTSGTGFGTDANKPATCTPGVGYFATDLGDGELLVCGPGNTWTEKYRPLVYPHPMVTNMSPQMPGADGGDADGGDGGGGSGSCSCDAAGGSWSNRAVLGLLTVAAVFAARRRGRRAM